MCTVSWFYQRGRLNLVMNRDELHTRASARPPEVTDINGCKAMLPIDNEHHGSWISVNEFGFVFCLLNHTEVPLLHEATRSRGLLLKDLSGCGEWTKLDACLTAVKLSPYAPFKLLIFSRLSGPVMYTWDQQRLLIHSSVQSPVSTSLWLPRLIPRMRQRWLRSLKPSSLRELEILHLKSRPIHAVIGVHMRRPHVRTVSVTSVSLSATKAVMRYIPSPSTQADEALVTSLPLCQALVSIESPPGGFTALNVRELFQRHNPERAARMNNLSWRFLTWLLKEKELNQKLNQFSSLSDTQFFDAASHALRLTPQMLFWRLPDEHTSPVFVCNHPTGGIDGVITLTWLLKRYPNLKVVANNALSMIPGIQHRLIPVDVFGHPQASAKSLQVAFKAKQPLLIFAAGKTARFSQGTLDDGIWTRAIATLARRYHRDLVPMHIESQNSSLFYAIHRLRQRLGMRVNLEMFLLPRELLRPQQRQPRIYVDIPVSPRELAATGLNDAQRMAWIKQRAYQLPVQFAEEKDDNRRATCSS